MIILNLNPYTNTTTTAALYQGSELGRAGHCWGPWSPLNFVAAPQISAGSPTPKIHNISRQGSTFPGAQGHMPLDFSV